jgi:hypothetical protein
MHAVPPAQATILLVDDTLENLNFLIACLGKTGFRIGGRPQWRGSPGTSRV